MSATPDVIERPFAGHFIGAKDCRFFRTTDVGGTWRISTVGDLHWQNTGPRQEIGYKRFYETYVFRLSDACCPMDCGGPCAGAPLIDDWSERDSEGYTTRAAAEAGHSRMVQKYVDSFAVAIS